jgi:hypothetical protein
MNKILKVGGIAGIALLAAAIAPALLVRPATNLPNDSRNSIQAQPRTSSALRKVLDRSCGDCHSNTMAERWYTRVPPLSALMAYAAKEGRKAVNFSEWTRYSPERQQALLLASCADAKRGTMPVEAYVRVRSDARLSVGDVETICSAAEQAAPSATSAANRTTPAR